MILKLPAVVSVSDQWEILVALSRGEQEIASGLGYDLDEILVEADRLLSQSVSEP